MEYLKKSFFIQHWEFIVLFISILYFFAKRRVNDDKNKRNVQNSNATKTQQVMSDDEVIASDYKSDEVDDENDGLTPALEDVDCVPYNGARVGLKGGAQEFFEMVNDRRSIRMFSNKPVDIEIVKRCILAAGTSPSGAHTEPWTFCLVQEYVNIFNSFKKI